MKKSIMLSATIMLVILFLTLTTTTFAWYQAQGGEIHVSGSSTASVTTTGPDSPYLVISSDGDFSSVTKDNYNNASNMTITPSQVSNLYVELAYPTFTAGVLTGFTSPATGQTNTDNVKKYTYYIKNIGDMDLLADFTAYKNSTNLSNPGENNDLHFAYMISLTDDENSTSYYYTSYYDASHALQAPASANSLADITISANTAYTVNFYVWVNNEAQFNNSNSVDSNASAIGNELSLKFENVEIKTTN